MDRKAISLKKAITQRLEGHIKGHMSKLKSHSHRQKAIYMKKMVTLMDERAIHGQKGYFYGQRLGTIMKRLKGHIKTIYANHKVTFSDKRAIFLDKKAIFMDKRALLVSIERDKRSFKWTKR